jgi:hypothetical protein
LSLIFFIELPRSSFSVGTPLKSSNRAHFAGPASAIAASRATPRNFCTPRDSCALGAKAAAGAAAAAVAPLVLLVLLVLLLLL